MLSGGLRARHLLSMLFGAVVATGVARADVVLQGTVTEPSGAGVAGARLDFSGGLPSTLSDSAGRWRLTLANAADGSSYTVRPTLADRTFAPALRTVVVSNGTARADFVANPLLGATPTLNVTATNYAPLTMPSGTPTRLLRLRLTAQNGPATVSALVLRDGGTAPGTSISFEIWQGATNLTLPPSPVDVLGKAWTHTLATPVNIASGASVDLDIREACTALAAGLTAQASLLSPADITANVEVTGSFALRSGVTTIADGAWVQASMVNLAPATITANLFTSMMKLRLAANAGAVTITGFRLRETGNALTSALAVQVLAGGKPVTIAFSFDPATRVWNIVLTRAITLSAGGYVYLELQELASSAAVGGTCGLALDTAAFVSASAPVAQTFPLASGTGTVAQLPFATFSTFSTAPTTMGVGTFSSMLKLRVTANNLPVTVDGLKVRDVGNAPAGTVSFQVTLSSRPVSGALSFDSGTKTWTLLFARPYTINPGAYLYFDLQAQATTGAAGKTVQLQLADSSAIQTTATVSGSFPQTSRATTVQWLDAVATDIASAWLLVGVANPMLRVTLTATGGAATVTGVVVRDVGSALGANLALTVLRDSVDVTPVSVPFDAATKTWTITFATPISLASGASTVLEFRESCTAAAIGATGRLTLADVSAITTTSCVLGTFPLLSGASVATQWLGVSGYSTAPATIGDGGWFTLYKLRLAANAGAVAVTSLRVQDIGTIGDTWISFRVVLSGRAVAGTTTYDNATKTWVFTFASAPSISAGSYCYYDLQVKAHQLGVGQTTRLQVPDVASVTASAPVTGAFPLASGTSSVVRTTLAIAPTSTAPANIVANASTSMLRLTLTATNAACTITGMTVQESGSAGADDVTLAVYAGATNVTPSNTNYSSGTRTWSLSFATPLSVPLGAGLTLDLRETVARTSLGQTARLAVMAVTTAAQLTTPPPMTSGSSTVLAPVAGVAVTDTAPSTVRYDTWATMLGVTVTAQGGPVTVTGLKVRDIGAAPFSALAVRLADPGTGDGVATTVSADSGTRTWTLTLATPVVLADAVSVDWNLQASGTTAAFNQTMQLRLVDNTCVLTSVAMPAGGAFPLDSSATRISAERLTVAASNRASATAIVDLNVAMMELTVTSNDTASTVTALVLRDTGTADAAGLSVRVVNKATSLEVPTSPAFDSATKTWTLHLYTSTANGLRPGVDLAAGDSFTYTIQEQGTAALAGSTMRLELVDTGCLQYQATREVVGTVPFATTETTLVGPPLDVSGTDFAPSEALMDNWVDLLDVHLRPTQGVVTMTGLKVRDSGSAPAGSVTIRLWDKVSGAEIPTLQTYDTPSRTWTLTLASGGAASVPITLPLGAPNEVTWTIQERGSSAAVGQTLQVSLDDTTFPVAQSPHSVTGTFPVTSGSSTVVAPTLRITSTDSAPATVLSGSWASMMALTLTAVDGPITLTALKLKDVGTLPAASGLQVRLTDLSGNWIPATSGYSSADKVWTLTFHTPVVLGAAGSVQWRAQAHGTEAAVDYNVQLSLVDATYVTASTPMRVSATFPVTSGATLVSRVPLGVSTQDPTPTVTENLVDTYCDMLWVHLATPGNAVTVTGLAVNDTGNAAIAGFDATSIRILNRDTREVVSATGVFTSAVRSWTLTLATPLYIPALSSADLILQERAGAAGVGGRVRLALDNVLYQGAVTVEGAPWTSSNQRTVVAPTLEPNAVDMVPVSAEVLMDEWATMLWLRFLAKDGPVTLDGFTLGEVGSLPDLANLELRVRDYAGGAITGCAITPDDVTKTWTVMLDAPVALGLGQYAEYLVDLRAGSAAVGETVQLELPNAAAVVGSGVYRVLAFAAKQSSIATVVAPTVAVNTFSQAPAEVVMGKDATLGQVTLAALDGPATITSLSFSLNGTAPVLGVSTRLLNAADNQDVAATVTGAGTADYTYTFDTPLSLAKGDTVSFVIVAQGTTGATVGQTLAATLPDAGVVGFVAPLRISGTFPQPTGETTVIAPTLSVSVGDLAPTEALVNSYQRMLSLRMTALDGPITVTGLVVADTGTVAGANLSTNDLRLVDPTTSLVVPATIVYTSATKTWTVTLNTPAAMVESDSLVYEIQQRGRTVALGSTIRARITSATGIVLSGVGTVSGTFPLTSGAATVVPPTLTVSSTDLATANTVLSAQTSMLRLTLKAEDGPATITSIKVVDTGTINYADLGIRLYDPVTSTPITAVTTTSDSSTKTWTFTFTTPVALATGETIEYVIQEVGQNTGAVGRYLRATLNDSSYIGYAGNLRLVGTFALNSGTSTVR